MCDEISVAEIVGLFSAISNRPVMPSAIICGRVVMSGSMMPVTTELDEIFVAAINAGAKTILLPADTASKVNELSSDIKSKLNVIFYKTPLEATKKALAIS